MEAKEPKAYLSTSEGRWRVISQGVPACRDTDEARARECAARFKLDVSHGRVWNGDAGRWEQDGCAGCRDARVGVIKQCPTHGVRS